MDVKNKVVVITGGAQGIGKVLAETLLVKGAKVILLDINSKGKGTSEELQKEFGEDKVKFFRCDVTDDKQFSDVFKEVVLKEGRIDIFVNNAGIINEKNWSVCVQVNLSGVIRGTNLALEHMRKDLDGEGGLIVNISSLGGLSPMTFAPTYSATKSAVLMYTKCLAIHPDQERRGVNFCSFCPAFADTGMLDSMVDGRLNDTQHALVVKDKLGVMTVDHVAGELCKLITDNINGSVMEVTAMGTRYREPAE